MQIITEIYTGSTLVYFIPKFHLKRLYLAGFTWTSASILILNVIFFIFEIGSIDLWHHVLFLSFISILHGFHMVILLGKYRIRMYSILLFMQPLTLLIVLCLNIFLFDIRTVHASIMAMYISWSLALLVSGLCVYKEIRADDNPVKLLPFNTVIKKGVMNQLGNLAHTLSSRYNYYLIGTNALVGVYSGASSLIESVLVISASVSPVVLTYIAGGKDETNSSKVTFLLAKISFLLSCICVLIILLVPNQIFVFLLGADFEHVKLLMLNLAPGVLCISFVSVISHYFSGLGEQKVQLLANTLGLSVILLASPWLIRHLSLVGACYATSLAYAVQALVLLFFFMKRNQFHIKSLFTIKQHLKLLK